MYANCPNHMELPFRSLCQFKWISTDDNCRWPPTVNLTPFGNGLLATSSSVCFEIKWFRGSTFGSVFANRKLSTASNLSTSCFTSNRLVSYGLNSCSWIHNYTWRRCKGSKRWHCYNEETMACDLIPPKFERYRSLWKAKPNDRKQQIWWTVILIEWITALPLWGQFSSFACHYDTSEFHTRLLH